MLSTSFIAIAAAFLMTGASTAQVLPVNHRDPESMPGADLQPPCAEFQFDVLGCTTFNNGVDDYNDVVRSIAIVNALEALDCTLYEEDCTNPGGSVNIPVVGTDAFNVPDDLKNLVSNFKCALILL
ncbi:hypothetical protein B0H13DRAFT_2335942 [Mycena leptocephala]|nr:hypothetical protein B0H13DRAFT_2335942 [Mycena leptocephala]